MTVNYLVSKYSIKKMTMRTMQNIKQLDRIKEFYNIRELQESKIVITIKKSYNLIL